MGFGNDMAVARMEMDQNRHVMRQQHEEIAKLRAVATRCDYCNATGQVEGFGTLLEDCDLCHGEGVIINWDAARAATVEEE